MLLKTYKLQLSTLLSEHIGPCTRDGRQPETQHFYSLRTTEAGHPGDCGKGYAPFPPLTQTGSRSHKRLGTWSCEGAPGGRNDSQHWFCLGQRCCPTENGYSCSSLQRWKRSTPIFILGGIFGCKFLFEREKEQNSH